MDSELDIVTRHLRTAPIDLEGIFADLGITYRAKPISGGESGWIERDGDRYRVVVNANEPVMRQRFTAAHELAHYLLHRDLMDDRGRLNRHTDRLYGAAASDTESSFPETTRSKQTGLPLRSSCRLIWYARNMTQDWTFPHWQTSFSFPSQRWRSVSRHLVLGADHRIRANPPARRRSPP